MPSSNTSKCSNGIYVLSVSKAKNAIPFQSDILTWKSVKLKSMVLVFRLMRPFTVRASVSTFWRPDLCNQWTATCTTVKKIPHLTLPNVFTVQAGLKSFICQFPTLLWLKNSVIPGYGYFLKLVHTMSLFHANLPVQHLFAQW